RRYIIRPSAEWPVESLGAASAPEVPLDARQIAMNKDQTPYIAGTAGENPVADRRAPAWGAIFAGAVAGLAVHILLMMLLTAIGLGAAEPATDDNPVATFGFGTGIAWTISAL